MTALDYIDQMPLLDHILICLAFYLACTLILRFIDDSKQL